VCGKLLEIATLQTSVPI